MKQTTILLVSASAAAFAFVFGNEADELPVLDLAILLVVLAAILVVQAGLLLGMNWLFRIFGAPTVGLAAAKLAAAAFVGSNAYFTAFITFEASFPIRVAISAGLGAAILTALFVRRWQGFALFVTSAYFIMSLGLYAYTRLAMVGDTAAVENAPRVQSARNVYLIGNESLHSPKAYRDVYDVHDLPHVDFLRRRGFRVLDRSYSADSSTLRSYSRLLDFRRELSGRDIARHAPFRSMNATFEAFSASGYRSQFIYRFNYFGIDPEVVTYAYPERSFGACAFTPRYFFYLFCRNWLHKRFHKLVFGMEFDLSVPLDRVRVAARSSEPWLTIYHHSYPFHSSQLLSYDDRDAVAAFRDRVLTAPDLILEKGMEAVVSTIQEEDPDAVIVLFGDHGAASTRPADIDTPPAPLSAAEILEDRYGVMVAVYPRDFCANRIFEGSTTLHLVDSVIRCLNGDDRPTAGELAQNRTFYWEGERRDVARYSRVPPGATQAPRPAP